MDVERIIVDEETIRDPDATIVDTDEGLHVWIQGKHLRRRSIPDEIQSGQFYYRLGMESGIMLVFKIKSVDNGTMRTSVLTQMDVTGTSVQGGSSGGYTLPVEQFRDKLEQKYAHFALEEVEE